MSYVAPAALPRPVRPFVGRSLLLLAILVHLAGLARLVLDYQRLQATTSRSMVSVRQCPLGMHLSLSTDAQQIGQAPRLLRLRGDVYLDDAPWLLVLSGLLLVGSIRSLLGAVPSVRGRRVLIVLLLGSGLALSMLHPAGFCMIRRSLNPV